MKLKSKYVERIKGSLALKEEIQEALGVSRTTIWTYLDDNHENLTRASVLKILSEHYNVSIDELLEETTKAA